MAFIADDIAPPRFFRTQYCVGVFGCAFMWILGRLFASLYVGIFRICADVVQDVESLRGFLLVSKQETDAKFKATLKSKNRKENYS